MSLETAFAKVVGRQATAEERERLFRLRDALGLADNDAFWSIVMALEHYDSLFRQYPADLARETARALAGVRATLASASAHEAARAGRFGAARPTAAGMAPARDVADGSPALVWFPSVLAAVVAFGALCVHAGYRIASCDTPIWASDRAGVHGAASALGTLLGVPAGWMVFALLLPASARGAKVGWDLARDPLEVRAMRALGAGIVSLCVLGAVASLAMLLRIA